MIDPLLPNSSAMRLAAMHSSDGKQPKRQKPAHTSKIFTAGLSTTALLGMVAAMGWPSGSSAAQSSAPSVPDPAAVTPVVFALPSAPPTTAAPAPVTVPATAATVAPLVTLPPTTPAPVVVTPAVIPVAVPAPAQPVVKKKRSHTTTKSSG